MAKGIGENPVKSPAYVATLVEYPVTRDELVQAAADSEAPAEVINFFKSLPAERYGSFEELLRDFAEAERRFADFTAAQDRGPGRANLGRAATENGRGPIRHP
jgi:hypothetical protein